jgi:hypothetical protein
MPYEIWLLQYLGVAVNHGWNDVLQRTLCHMLSIKSLEVKAEGRCGFCWEVKVEGKDVGFLEETPCMRDGAEGALRVSDLCDIPHRCSPAEWTCSENLWNTSKNICKGGRSCTIDEPERINCLFDASKQKKTELWTVLFIWTANSKHQAFQIYNQEKLEYSRTQFILDQDEVENLTDVNVPDIQEKYLQTVWHQTVQSNMITVFRFNEQNLTMLNIWGSRKFYFHKVSNF